MESRLTRAHIPLLVFFFVLWVDKSLPPEGVASRPQSNSMNAKEFGSILTKPVPFGPGTSGVSV